MRGIKPEPLGLWWAFQLTFFPWPFIVKLTILYIPMEHGLGILVAQIKDRKFLIGDHWYIYKHNQHRLLCSVSPRDPVGIWAGILLCGVGLPHTLGHLTALFPGELNANSPEVFVRTEKVALSIFKRSLGVRPPHLTTANEGKVSWLILPEMWQFSFRLFGQF